MANSVILNGYILNFITKVQNPDGTQKWVYGIDKSTTYPPKAHDFILTFTLCENLNITKAEVSPGEGIDASFDNTAKTVTFKWNGEGQPLSKEFSFTVDKTYTEETNPASDNVSLTATGNPNSSDIDEKGKITVPSCTPEPPSKGIDFRALKDIDLYE